LAPSAQIVFEFAEYQRTLLELQRIERVNPPAAEPAPEPQKTAGDADPSTMNPNNQNAGNDPVNRHRRDGRNRARNHYGMAASARSTAAVTSKASFVERLVHFWSNHFAVSADKLEVLALAGSFEFEAIRPHVLGSFRDMLHAVERHPAMLLFLDQARSVGPNSQFAQRAPARVRVGFNENLAREILELHTLGVRTGYTQADVTELARALTGWTVPGLGVDRRNSAGGNQESGKGFAFSPILHEPGARSVLGQRFEGEGEQQAAAILDVLSLHPSTARHIATKLARHFAGDEPPTSLIEKLEKAFLESGGDLPTIYRALIEASECWVAAPVKFKSPWEWAISAMRALGLERVPRGDAVGLFAQLGRPVWRPGSPAGWDDTATAWVGSDAIVRRVEAAGKLVDRSSGLDARERAEQLFADNLTETTTRSIARAESPNQALALMLVAPEFMRR